MRPMATEIPFVDAELSDDDDAATVPVRRPPPPTMPPPSAVDPRQVEYARLVRHAWASPFDPAIYKQLYAFAVRHDLFDLAWRALDVLMIVGAPNRSQVDWLLENPPPELAKIPHPIPEDAWDLLGAGARDPILTSLLGWTAAAWARADVTRNLEAGHRPSIRPVLGVSHTNLFSFLQETTEAGATRLGLVPPTLLVGGISGPAFSLAYDPWGALLVTVPSAEARGEAAFFDLLVALAYLRADLTLSALAPSPEALASHVHAALSDDPELLAFVDPPEQGPLSAVLVHARREWATGLPDFGAWLATSRETALRAAVTLCGSVQDAQMALGGVHGGTGHLALGRLFPWFVSPEHGLLRKRMGIAVPEVDDAIVI